MYKAALYNYRYPEYSLKLRPLRGIIAGMMLNVAVLAALCVI